MLTLKILTRSCSFHGHFQTLGFAPTHSLECLFFFFSFSAVKKKNNIAAGCFHFQWISSVKIKNSSGLLFSSHDTGNFIYIGHFMRFALNQMLFYYAKEEIHLVRGANNTSNKKRKGNKIML